jgi:methionyl-tRNA formyltransferase
MKILFCAYREWALSIYAGLDAIFTSQNHILDKVITSEDLDLRARSENWDVIILVGWSWKVPADIVNNKLVIGMHPSNLPHYSGGSPIQNQILDGIEDTCATLFKLNEQFDEGEIIDKEPIDLRGHLDDVLKNIASASTNLILRFVEKFPNNQYAKQPKIVKTRLKRLKPDNSQLPSLNGMTCKEMWDFIRCREDPYPNAYFHDQTGTLTIKRVEFTPK